MIADDRQLLLATHRGHEASARLLWDRHGPRLIAHARAILRSPAAADDVVQTVMCRLLKLPKARLVAVTDVAAFLSGSVRHEAINHLRSMRRECARRGRTDNVSALARHMLVSDHEDHLSPALERLPRRLREIVILKHAGGLTFDQIALVLEANRNTVAARYRTALKALRTMLDPQIPTTKEWAEHRAPNEAAFDRTTRSARPARSPL